MENNLAGKTAVVTGASRGIGRATAIELAKRGANVVVNYNGSAEAAQEVAEECSKYAKAIAIKANVAEESDCQKLFAQVVEEFGKVDILVNNAGITKDGLLVRMSTEDFAKVIDTNLKGAFLCLREAAKIMMKARYGRIVNISSVVGVHGNAGQVNYSAAKAGIIGMSKSAAKELAARKITVNAIAPGFIQTDMTECLNDKVKEEMQKQIPLKEIGTAQDVAEAAAFLASDSARYITGVVLGVDGGMGM